jgi:hypothetical protein
MNKKTEKHLGQLQLNGVSEYDQQTEGLPRGMPPLSEIKSYTAQLGLPDTDAEHLYDIWLMNGFKTARGLRIVSWMAAIRYWNRSKFFPSQKKNPPKAAGEMTNEILDALAANPSYKKIDVQAQAWVFKKWCQDNDRQPLVTSFVKFLNAKL